MDRKDVGFVWHEVPEPAPSDQHGPKPSSRLQEYAYENGEIGPEELEAMRRGR